MLEICCGSYYDVLQAQAGGANRIELNSALYLGGLTPSPGTLELVRENCRLPIIAMVRPRGGGFCYREEEFEVMMRDCRYLIRHGADGIAFGCLKEDSSIDRERSARLISMIHSHGKEAVFHRAFDCTINPYEAIETLIELGADRLLTSGRKGRAQDGKALLGALQSAYGRQIQLLAGGGVNASNVKRLMSDTGINQVHSSCRDWLFDPTTRTDEVIYSFAPSPYEDCYDAVSEQKVREMAEKIRAI